MKSVLLFISVLGIISSLNAQAPKHTRRITISMHARAEENYHSLAHSLLDKGYQIDGDREFLTIRTSDSQISGSTVYVQYYFVCKDNEIVISGRATAPSIDKFVYVDIENKGKRWMGLKEAFEDMEKLAQSLGTISGYQ